MFHTEACFYVVILFLCWEHFSLKTDPQTQMWKIKSSGLWPFMNWHVASWSTIICALIDGRATYHFCDACPSSCISSLFWQFCQVRWQNCGKWLLTSLCLSVYVEQRGCHWTDFCEIWCLSIFWKSVEKIQVSLKSDKNNGYFTWRSICIFYNVSLISS